MVFYYVLHHTLLETETFKDGKRNCATFLFGTVLYAVLYVITKNMQLRFGLMWDAIATAIVAVWFADACTMAYVYRSHFGRSILHEVTTPEGWKFDKSSHTYKRPSKADVLEEALEVDGKLMTVIKTHEDARESAAKQARGDAIRRRKEEVRAACVIQRWWRARLYNPPDGILYLKALRNFQEAQGHREAEKQAQE